MVAWARFAASIRAPFTASRLLITSGSQSNNSTRRCRPRAFNPVALLSPIRSSTAPLLRRPPASPLDEKISRLHQNLFHCMARYFRLQEKNTFWGLSGGALGAGWRPDRGLSASERPAPPSPPRAAARPTPRLPSTFRLHRGAATVE